MEAPQDITQFLAAYEMVFDTAMQLRKLVLQRLPDITEQVDLSAKMIAYAYGRKYTALVCVIIPSKKGLKLGFNKGPSLPDPNGLLEGTGKVSRYVVIRSAADIQSDGLKTLLDEALAAFRERTAQS